MITDALKALSYNRLTKIGFVMFGVLLAPYMFIFQFAQHIFNDNSIVPLLLISVCVGLPVALVLFVLRVWDDAGLDPTDPKEKLATRFGQMSTASLMSGVGFYLPCCAKFFQPQLDLRSAVGFMIPFLGAIVVSSVTSIARGGTKALFERMDKYIEKTEAKKKINK